MNLTFYVFELFDSLDFQTSHLIFFNLSMITSFSEQDEIQNEMLKYSLPVEPLVDPATNAARIQTRACRGDAPVCLFNNSILNPMGNPLDPAVMEQNTKTRDAFTLYTGLGKKQAYLV